MSRIFIYIGLIVLDIIVLTLDAVTLYRIMKEKGIIKAGLPIASVSLIAFALGLMTNNLIYYLSGK